MFIHIIIKLCLIYKHFFQAGFELGNYQLQLELLIYQSFWLK